MGKETIGRLLKLKIELQSAFNGRQACCGFYGIASAYRPSSNRLEIFIIGTYSLLKVETRSIYCYLISI